MAFLTSLHSLFCYCFLNSTFVTCPQIICCQTTCCGFETAFSTCKPQMLVMCWPEQLYLINYNSFDLCGKDLWWVFPTKFAGWRPYKTTSDMRWWPWDTTVVWHCKCVTARMGDRHISPSGHWVELEFLDNEIAKTWGWASSQPVHKCCAEAWPGYNLCASVQMWSYNMSLAHHLVTGLGEGKESSEIQFPWRWYLIT